MASEEIRSRMASVRTGVSSHRRELDVDIGRREALKEDLDSERDKLLEENSSLDLYERCRNFLRRVLESTQETIERTFSEFTTAGIASVFGDDKAFRFQFVPTAQGVAVKVHVLKPSPTVDGEMIEISPRESEGGGMLDIISVEPELDDSLSHEEVELLDPLELEEDCRSA